MAFLDDYEPVEDRLRAFWSEHYSGRVLTELVQSGKEPGDVIVFKAVIFRAHYISGNEVGLNEQPCATGYAHQRLLAEPPKGRNGKPNDSAPEWTSPFEVAETSAIGRGLANLGYAAKGKRPWREEMSKNPSGPRTPDGAGGRESGQRTSPTRPSEDTASGNRSAAQASVAPASGVRAADGGQEGEAHGEGVEPSSPATTIDQGTGPLWDTLAGLAADSDTKARTWINQANKTSYTAKNVYRATAAELTAAIEAHGGSA